jgi:hypothetical protein
MNVPKLNNRLAVIFERAQALETLLNELEPEMATQVFGLVLAVKSNEQREAIYRAAKMSYQRKTLAEAIAPYKPTITFPDRKE